MSSHCLLASLVFNEKWAVNLFEDPLCVTNCFFLAAFKILLLLLAFDNLIITYVSVDFFEFFLIGCYWSSRIYRFMYLIKLGSFCLYFLKYFFYPFISLFSFRDFHDVYIGPFDGTPQILQILLTFLHFFFASQIGLFQFVLSPILLILSSTLTNLLFNPSTKFLISDIVLFSSKIPFCFLFIISISVDIVMVFIHHFPGFL